MALYPVAGCKFYISEDPFPEKSADVVAADFTAVTWQEVGKWTSMGPYGDSAQLITTDLIGEGRTKKMKGTRNAGSMANVFAVDMTDDGQILMIEASETLNNYAFKVELNDSDGGVGATNSHRLFYGLVMQSQEAGGGANTVQTMNATVEINSNIVTVAATPGTLAAGTGRGGGGPTEAARRSYGGGAEQPAGVKNLHEGKVQPSKTEKV
jgi:hypothetical protein